MNRNALNTVAVYMKFIYFPSVDPGSVYFSGSAFAILCVCFSGYSWNENTAFVCSGSPLVL